MLQVFYHHRFTEHLTGRGHPERPARLAAFIEGLAQGGSAPDSFIAPTPLDRGALASVHDEPYLSLIERYCESLQPGEVGELPTGDTMVGHDSFEIALLAAGAAVSASERARVDAPALGVTRPPGHHAEPARGMGFCLLNNAALAAAHARANGAVLIVDLDYHHGNGTQAWVEEAHARPGPPLGFISTHAYPAYPGTGAFDESQVANNGFVIDIPLAHSTDTEDFVAVWSTLLPATTRRIKPATIVVSAGFDFLAGDPIAGLPIDISAVDALCGLIGQAGADAGAGIALVLEGGYSLENLKASGEALARSFGACSARTAVPAARVPADKRLAAMTAEALRWLVM
ncbi:MAG TPA: hypothetical protein VN934_03800 [Candidatus Tumulicola sp.]|nr:hypothetical protein [Candidatus Tumulicola sp.]